MAVSSPMASLPKPDTHMDPARQSVVRMKTLLKPTDDDASARWDKLDTEGLDQEIAAYRETIKDVIYALEGLGVSVSADEDQAAQQADGASTATGLEDLGEEGVDYTLGTIDDLDPEDWQVPQHCIPIHANVTRYNWQPLIDHTHFDVVMMDPPWQLATANPTRGVSLGYSQLTDEDIINMPIPKLQPNGYLFIWVINAKFEFTMDLFDRWGYSFVDEIVWVKMTMNRRMAKSHGFYLQHAKEVCLVGRRGGDPAGTCRSVGSDIIFSERRGQSQKPEEIYQLVEQLVPGGKYLEIFGRKNNLRDFWVTMGNEVTGRGLPKEDLAAMRLEHGIPGAVFGGEQPAADETSLPGGGNFIVQLEG